MRCKTKNMVYSLPGVDNDPEYTRGQRITPLALLFAHFPASPAR